MKDTKEFEQLIGELIGDYIIDEVLGYGGQAVVYKAHERKTRRLYALKVFGLGETFLNINNGLEEAKRQAQINHSSVIKIYVPDILEVKINDSIRQILYIPMDYASRGNCNNTTFFSKRMVPLNIDDLQIIVELLDGLKHIHDAEIIHNDIKPANILLVDERSRAEDITKLCITDFGIAKVRSQIFIQAIGNSGLTTAYMSPEQPDGKYSEEGDIYSMGATLFYLLTGIDPIYLEEGIDISDINAWQNAHKSLPRPNAMEYNPYCHPRLALLIMQMMSVEPNKRSSLDYCINTLKELIKTLKAKEKGFDLPEELKKQMEVSDKYQIRYISKFRDVFKPLVHEKCITQLFVISIKLAHPIFSQYKRVIEDLVYRFSDTFCMYETYGTYDIQILLWTNGEKIKSFENTFSAMYPSSEINVSIASQIDHLHSKLLDFPKNITAFDYAVNALAIQECVEIPGLLKEAYLSGYFPEEIPEHSVRAFTFVETVQNEDNFHRAGITAIVKKKMEEMSKLSLTTNFANQQTLSMSAQIKTVDTAPMKDIKLNSGIYRTQQTLKEPPQKFPRISVIELSPQSKQRIMLIDFVARDFKFISEIPTAIIESGSLGEKAIKTSTFIETGRIIIQSDKILF